MAKMIKIFKPGRHVDSKGNVHNFTEAQLRASAAAYNPVLHAAPMVIGHPKLDDPKYGTIQRIEFADNLYQGEPAKLDPQFAEAVNAGRWDRVSPSWYSPDSPSNPVPGVYYLRHLGFLGAVPPGCKGLGAVSFAEGEEGVIEFADWDDMNVAGLFRNLRDFLIETFGKDKADSVIPDYQVTDLAVSAAMPDKEETNEDTTISYNSHDSHTSQFSEPTKGDAMTKEELEKREKELLEGQKKLRNQLNDQKHAGNLEFCEGLVKEGRLLATNKLAAVAALDFAEGVTTGDTIEFGEGDAKKTQTPAEIIKALLSSSPKVINFSEFDFSDTTEPAKTSKAIPADITKYV
jgi:hypothetical protein